MKPHLVKINENKWECACFKHGKGANASGIVAPLGSGKTAAEAYSNWKWKTIKRAQK